MLTHGVKFGPIFVRGSTSTPARKSFFRAGKAFLPLQCVGDNNLIRRTYIVATTWLLGVAVGGVVDVENKCNFSEINPSSLVV